MGIPRVSRTGFVDVDDRGKQGYHMVGLGYRREQIARLVIDNLVKGASGQAVRNLNLRYDYADETGLLRGGW